LIYVNLASQFYQYLNGFSQITSPTYGAQGVGTTLTGGAAYVISTVGTTTATQWYGLGLPVGIIPAVGAAFIPPASSTSSGTGQVVLPNTSGSGIAMVDLIGTPSGQATAGTILILRTLASTSSSVTTLTSTAPVDGAVIKLHFALLPLSGQLK